MRAPSYQNIKLEAPLSVRMLSPPKKPTPFRNCGYFQMPYTKRKRCF